MILFFFKFTVELIKDMTIKEDCSFMQSKLEGEDKSIQNIMWILCADTLSNSFLLFRFDTISRFTI